MDNTQQSMPAPPGTPGTDYTRQATLGLTVPHGVAVVGCGGVGSWTAWLLGLSGVKKLYLFDPDTLSSHNFNRLPLTQDQVGQQKSSAVRELIIAHRPEATVVAFGAFSPEVAEALGLYGEVSWIVATTDSHASRSMVSDWAKNWGINYLEAAAEGEIGSITGEPAEFTTELETHPGYQSVPVWAGPCINAASLAVTHILHSRRAGIRPIPTARLGWDNNQQEFRFYRRAA